MFDIITATLKVSPQLNLVRTFFETEGLPFKLLCDQRFVMQHTRGKAHPETGFVVLTTDGETLLDIYDVVKYVERVGLKPL